MKWLALLIVIFAGTVCHAQTTTASCPQGLICYSQSQNNDIKAKLDELMALRDAYAKLLAERSLTDAERTATVNVIKIAGDTITILQKGIADREAVIALQQKALQLYADLVEKLTTQINKPKSALAKFADAVKEIALIALGITVGRGL